MNESKTYDQPTLKPTAKVAAVGTAGVAVTLILVVASLFGITIPADTVNDAVIGVSAIVTLVTFVAGYFKKSSV